MDTEPKIGRVVYFDYLWKSEADAGREHGLKDRRSMIIDRSPPDERGERIVHLLAITHRPLSSGQTGVEIPHKMGRHLGLDDDRSWVKTHEINQVYWPKDRLPFGLTPASSNQMEIGQMHHSIGRQAFGQVRENSRQRSLARVRRDEPELSALQRRVQAALTRQSASGKDTPEQTPDKKNDRDDDQER